MLGEFIGLWAILLGTSGAKARLAFGAVVAGLKPCLQAKRKSKGKSEKQIPFGNDKRKGNDNGKSKGNGNGKPSGGPISTRRSATCETSNSSS